MLAIVFRTFIVGALCVAGISRVSAQEKRMRVTLLGTGCPPPVMNRFGPSTLVEAGGQKLVFDAGRGALQRLTQLSVRWPDVQGVFLTHLHSDHVVGFPDLWLTGWLIAPGRTVPLNVWGPRGTSKMMFHLRQAYESDIRIRLENERVSPAGVLIIAKDIRDGIIYDKGGVKVTAFEVDHRPVKPAFGYRIDYAGRSVVLSGDTRVSENLIRHANGVDLLVHEVFAPGTLKRMGVPAERADRIIAYHLTPEEAGRVFTGRSRDWRSIRTSAGLTPLMKNSFRRRGRHIRAAGTWRRSDGDRSRREDRSTKLPRSSP